jgi:hypothetical protein
MAIHVNDAETDWLVREFARRRGVGITAAIKLAIEEATQTESVGYQALATRIEPIRAQIRARKIMGFDEAEEKAFMDEGWGET